MENIELVSGIVEFLLSFALGLVVAYASFRIFARMTRDIDEVRELKGNNIAVGILLASMLLSVAIIVKNAIYPAISSLQTYLFEGVTTGAVAKAVGLGLGYIVSTMVLAIIAVSLGMRMFLKLTRDIDELAEIRKNNIAVAVTLGATIIVLSLFLENGIGSLLRALIPFPAIENVQIMGGP